VQTALIPLLGIYSLVVLQSKKVNDSVRG